MFDARERSISSRELTPTPVSNREFRDQQSQHGGRFDQEVEQQETAVAEAVATIARLSQAIARIQGYLRELERTFRETQDADVARTIEQRNRQLVELQGHLRAAEAIERAASRREAQLASIFESDEPGEPELPRAFLETRSHFFQDLLTNKANPWLQSEWLQDPRTREAMIEHLDQHVPSFAAVQEGLIHLYEQLHPEWSDSERALYVRHVLPSYLQTLAYELDRTGVAIAAADPDADLTPVYEQAAELLLRRFDRLVTEGTDGRVLWAPLRTLNRQDEPFRLVLEHHQRAGGPEHTRTRLIERFTELVNTAVSRGEEPWELARSVLHRYQKFGPELSS